MNTAVTNTSSQTVSQHVSKQRPLKKLATEEYRQFQDALWKKQGQTHQVNSSGEFIPYSYAELSNMDLRPEPWLIKGLMRINEVAMVYAGTGVGKTWSVLGLSMIAAGGGQLLDWSNEAPRKVLYLDGEMDAGELVGRMKRLAEGLKCDPEALGKNFVLCSRQMQQTILGSFIEIETEESQYGILQYAQEHRFDLIVIDNLTTLSGQIDENASKDLKLFNNFLLRAKQLNIGVLVVHHQGKGKDSGPRGSSAMVATLNLILKLEPSTQERAAGDKDAKFTIVFEKNRGNVDSRPLPVVVTRAAFDDLTDKDTEASEDQWPLVLMNDPDADSNVIRAKKLLQTGKFKNQSELANAFGVKQPAMSKILSKAIAQGELTKDAIGGYYQRAREAENHLQESEVGEGNPDF